MSSETDNFSDDLTKPEKSTSDKSRFSSKSRAGKLASGGNSKYPQRPTPASRNKKFERLKNWLENEATDAEIISWQRNRAIYFLSRREYSEKEIQQKLTTKIERSDLLISKTIEDLRNRGYLSDERFARQQISAKSGKFGSGYLKNMIRQKGVSDDVIEEQIEEAGLDDFETAKAVFLKKFKQPAADNKERDRQVRFLASRGFSFDIIKKVMGSAWDDLDGDGIELGDVD